MLHVICQYARSEAVPGVVQEGEPTLFPGTDAIVISTESGATKGFKMISRISKRWRSLALLAPPWQTLRSMELNGELNWEAFQIVHGDAGGLCWAASSTTREEGKMDKWHTVKLPCGDRTVMLIRKCSEEGVSYDIIRWVGCLQGMHHPCIAALQLVNAKHDTNPGPNHCT